MTWTDFKAVLFDLDGVITPTAEVHMVAWSEMFNAFLTSYDGPVTDRSPYTRTLPREDSRDALWVRPLLVVEVRYGQVTPDMRLRFPRFVRVRDDKAPTEVVDE